MSPRRSSRARTSQPVQNGPQQSGTSSSTSSGRGERNSRSISKQDAPVTLTASRSVSSEEIERQENMEQELRRTRKSKRDGMVEAGQEHMKNEDNIDDDELEDEGVTRCVCRQQDYPGPPVPLTESARNHQAKEPSTNTTINGGEVPSEDAGGLFIQCDVCQVWQHGGCVGIMDEGMSPEFYYCEECRKDLHKLMTGARGQKYSRYLPVFNNIQVMPPTESPGKDSDRLSSREADSKLGNSNAAIQSAKRRSTMNSRAAYDEEEVIRRVLEESKSEGTVSGANGGRKGKRGRDDSEDMIQEFKRRKTGSESATPPSGQPETADADSDEAHGRKTSHGRKKGRGEVTQGQRDKEPREQDLEKEKERIEAANRRKGRADRRRIDESETPDDVNRTNNPNKSIATTSRSTKVQKQASDVVQAATLNVSHKKNGRSQRRGRLGRNQYTKDRETAAESAFASPRLSQSRDEEEIGNEETEDQAAQLNGNGSKPSKPRLMNPQRTSMNDMKRRVAGILEYITRTQVDLAGEKTSAGSGPGSTKNPGRAGPNGASKLSHEINGEDAGSEQQEIDEVHVGEEEFKKLSTLDMMDVLTRELMHWQHAHGKWGASGR